VTTRHEEIADLLTEEILRGRYRPGDRLPSERDLAARFDANRGAVREAIKKLEQLGLADVQPGGARVRAVEDASLEVLGHLMTLDALPDVDLVEQMMDVTHSLLRLAAERAMERADDADIAHARALIQRLQNPELDMQELIDTRLEMVRHFMRMSGNLVLTLISRTLRVDAFEKASPASSFLHRQSQEHTTYLKQLDQALERRDAQAAVATLRASFELNRELVLGALAEAHARTDLHLRNGQSNGAMDDAGRSSSDS
jgi:GntR family transcriptional repressor for pyruvate dehydrogenase complex